MMRLTVVIAVAACGGAPARGDLRTCAIVRDQAEVPRLADLSAVKPYRNYYAVGHFTTTADHFVARRKGVSLHVVVREEAGRRRVHVGWATSRFTESSSPFMRSSNAGELQRLVEAELARRCGEPWSVRYDGRYRTAVLYRLIARDDRPGTRRGGWVSAQMIVLDESLTKVIGTMNAMSGFGRIEVPADAQWLTVSPPDDLVGTTFDPGTPFDDKILAAVRRHDAGTPSPSVDSLVAPGAPRIPPGVDENVTVKIMVVADTGIWETRQFRPASFALRVSDAVLGKATGDAVIDYPHTRFKVRATLQTKLPVTEGGRGRFVGTFSIRVEDGRGHHWESGWPVDAVVDVEGDRAAAPYGFSLWKKGTPTITLPGDADFKAFELRVESNLKIPDPR